LMEWKERIPNPPPRACAGMSSGVHNATMADTEMMAAYLIVMFTSPTPQFDA
jgi:hypothetical protein